MAVLLDSPHPFSERLLLFGGGGAGKTEAVLSIAEHLGRGHMHVIDADYSMAYERALATTHADAEDRVTVHACDAEWQPFRDVIAEAIAAADPAEDWLVVDPISPSWDWVQSWYLEQVYSHDLARHIVELRQAYPDNKEYQRALSDDMNWQAVKKEYAAGLYSPIQKWKGNLVLVAEAKAVGRFGDDDEQMLYGPIGFKPAGESRLKHIASTTLFLDHPKRAAWRMTTVKDRNREELDKVPVEDFAMDYLAEVAGWEPVRRAKASA